MVSKELFLLFQGTCDEDMVGTEAIAEFLINSEETKVVSTTLCFKKSFQHWTLVCVSDLLWSELNTKLTEHMTESEIPVPHVSYHFV